MDDFKLKNGSGRLCCGGCGRQNNKLNTYDWLADIPGNADEQDMVEVQFKNTRKGYYKNSNGLHLEKGDIVAVEASPGHDIGTVTLTGRLVLLQMRKANLKPDAEIRRIYRKVKPVDMEKYEEAKQQLLAGISHDLRTPLTSIKAYVEGLRDGIANTEEKKRRYYDAIKIRTEDLADLIDNLSLFSRFDRGEYHYSMERIDFGEFVDSFLRSMALNLKTMVFP